MTPCLCGDVKNYHTSLSLPGFLEIFKDGDKLRIVTHRFAPIDYEEKIFEPVANIVQFDYSRKLNKNFKVG